MTTQPLAEDDPLASDHHDEEFAAFYAHYAPRLRRYCMLRFGPGLADDLLQQTMERALVYFARLGTRDPWPWLLVVARNGGCNAIRNGNKCQPVDVADLAQLPAQRWSDPEEVWASGERGRDVAAALDRLSAGQKQVLLLRLEEELSFETIAWLLGSSENAVRQQLFKARKAFMESYRSLASQLPAVGGLAMLGAGVRKLRELARRSVSTACTTSALVIATGAVLMAPGLWSGSAEGKPLDTSAAVVAATAPGQARPAAHRTFLPHQRVDDRAPAAPTPTRVIAVRLARSPLASGRVAVLTVHADTPLGPVDYRNEAVNGDSGPLCTSLEGLCR